uniref:NADH dehydrogenase subunit 6 n=1 Tax=Paradiplozoon yunnanensis TaxID=2268894 RepID=UPI001FAF9EA3|nr:NADH dehydrogenase subunit 6 [Paradiplozoon yunnanensis]UKP90065.1 NADH dehydrogenase subunit 6 [Paradiplozoon yunnanensis]
MLSLILFCYFFFSLLSCFVGDSIFCSLILIFNVVNLSLFLYFYLGLVWYVVLILLLYFGGVYVIILYVSCCNQNDLFEEIFSAKAFFILILVVFFLFLSDWCFGFFWLFDFYLSSSLVVFFDFGNVYFFLCFLLLFLFCVVSHCFGFCGFLRTRLA